MPGEPGAVAPASPKRLRRREGAALRETLEDLRAENRWMWDRMSEADRLSLARRRAHRVRESTISLSYWQESTSFVSLSVEDALGEVWWRISGIPES